jgi:predicted DNA-binding transcriptional regulator AlpA
MPNNGLDRLIRKKTLLELIDVDYTTLWLWVKQGRFPSPLILNAHAGSREIIAWRESEVVAWQASLPQRMARVTRHSPYPTGPRQRKQVVSRPGE